jgi:hypothetical protein
MSFKVFVVGINIIQIEKKQKTMSQLLTTAKFFVSIGLGMTTGIIATDILLKPNFEIKKPIIGSQTEKE